MADALTIVRRPAPDLSPDQGSRALGTIWRLKSRLLRLLEGLAPAAGARPPDHAEPLYRFPMF